MADQFIVERSGILGPPNTDRMFQRGELVEPDDFRRCPGMLAKLLQRGSIREAKGDEITVGRAQREANDATALGMPADAPRPEVLALLKERKEVFDREYAAQEAQRPNPALPVVPPGGFPTPPQPPPPVETPAHPVAQPTADVYADQRADEARLRQAAEKEAAAAAEGKGPARKAAAHIADDATGTKPTKDKE